MNYYGRYPQLRKEKYRQHYVDDPEEGGSKVLRNVGVLTYNYTVSQPRRQGPESSSKWEQNLARS